MSFQLARSEIEASAWFPHQEYPFPSQYQALAAGRMHYVDEGRGAGGAGGAPVVFVHGTPSWSFEFREQIRDLRTAFRCLAPDHLGFGLSERPDDFDYSVASHRKNFAEFIANLNLEKVSLVVHDFGGPIALPFAVENPGRIDRLVIINSWFWPLADADPKFARDQKWIDTPLMKFLYLRMNFSANMLVKLAWGKHRPLDRRTHDHYRRLFPTAESRASTWALARAMVNSANDFADYQTRLASLRAVRTLFIWGMNDRFVPDAHLKKWRALLPAAEELILPDTGHFPQDEAPELVTPKLREFLARN